MCLHQHCTRLHKPMAVSPGGLSIVPELPITYAHGSGVDFEREWLLQVGRVALPEPMVLYRAQLRLAAERDVIARPELAAAFAAAGFAGRDVQNKTHYVCNSEIERAECDDGITAREVLAETVAYESDGHPCLVRDLGEGPAVLKRMNQGLECRKQFVIKPYRNQQQLIDALKQKFPEVPAELFEVVDENWQDKAQKLLEFKRRMLIGENPVLLSRDLVLIAAVFREWQ